MNTQIYCKICKKKRAMKKLKDMFWRCPACHTLHHAIVGGKIMTMNEEINN